MSDALTPQDKPAVEKKTAAEKKAEKLNALPWQPWKLNDLNTPLVSAKAKNPIEPLFPEDHGAEEHQDIEPLSQFQVDQNELQRLQIQAQQQGHQQGFEAGQQQGYQAGFQAGQEAGHVQGVQEAQQQQAVHVRLPDRPENRPDNPVDDRRHNLPYDLAAAPAFANAPVRYDQPAPEEDLPGFPPHLPETGVLLASCSLACSGH